MNKGRLGEADFVIANVQTVAMFAGNCLQPNKALHVFLAHFPARFDGELQALPLPPEMPAELPRIILESADKRFHVEIGPSRLSCQINNLQSNGLTSENLPAIVEECSQMLEACLSEFPDAKPGRLSLVLSRFCRCDNPAQTLIQQFCNEESQIEPLNRSATFEINNHKSYSLPNVRGGIAVNSWVRCKSAMLIDGITPIIVVEQDLNTVLSPDQDEFSNADSKAFFDVVALEATGILKKYFHG